jgi:hypothetical protein
MVMPGGGVIVGPLTVAFVDCLGADWAQARQAQNAKTGKADNTVAKRRQKPSTQLMTNIVHRFRIKGTE